MNDIIGNSSGDGLSAGKIKLPTFKEIKKESLGKSYEFLNKLIKGKSFEDFENINELLNPPEPLSSFEESLRLILIDGLHLKDEVMKVLLSQNDYHISRILRCDWFFKNSLLFDEFIKIFPRISTSVKYKIITKLSKHIECEVEAEKISAFLYENFNCESAELMLPKCRKMFILNYLKEAKPLFQYNTSCRVLLNLNKRHSDIVGDILLRLFDPKIHYPNWRLKKLLRDLATRDPTTFILLLEKRHSQIPNFKLGRKLSRFIGLKLKSQILKSTKFNKIFRIKSLFSTLSEQDQIKFLTAIVRDDDSERLLYLYWDNVIYTLASFIKLVNPRRRLMMIKSVFKELYNSDFTEQSKLWSSEILELIPTDERIPFVAKIEELLEKDEEDDFHFSFHQTEHLVYLYDFETAFGKFKEILSKAPNPRQRQNILNFMVKNCRINRDPSGLQQLVDFVEKRHRNDDNQLINSFISSIINSFSTSHLNSKIFEKLEEFSYFCALKSDPYSYREVVENHVIYRLDNGMEVETHLKRILNFFIFKCGNVRFISNYRTKHSKYLVLAYCKEIMNCIEKNKSEEKREEYITNILETCKEHNRLNKKNKISLTEISGLEKELRSLLIKKYADLGGEDWSLNIYQRFYCETLNKYSAFKIVMYAMKQKPEIFEKNFSKIVSTLLDNYSYRGNEFIINLKKIISFMELSDEFKKLLLDEFHKENSSNKRMALTLYSHVATVEEFSETVADYIPKAERIDQEAEADFSDIQLTVPKLIRNLTPRWKSLDLILKFFMGDFLRAVMPSLYVCSYRTRTDKVLPFLKKHLNEFPNRISYKKDIIRLIAAFSTREETVEFCMDCWEKNPHYSIRTILLIWIRKLFLEQPTRKVFKALEKCIVESDEIVIDAMPKIELVSDEFLPEYVDALWEFSKNKPPRFQRLFRNGIIYFFKLENIGLLPSEFCEKTIRDNPLKSKSSLDIKEFAIYYLMYNPEKVESRMTLILEWLKGVELPELTGFLDTLYRISLENKRFFPFVFHSLLENCPAEIPFKNRVILTFFWFYHKIGEANEENFDFVRLGKSIRNYCDELNHLSDLVVLLIDCLSDFVQNLKNHCKSFNELLVIKSLVEGPLNKSAAIIGIMLLPNMVAKMWDSNLEGFSFLESKFKEHLDEIIKILKSYSDEVVEIYCKTKFGVKWRQGNLEA